MTRQVQSERNADEFASWGEGENCRSMKGEKEEKE